MSFVLLAIYKDMAGDEYDPMEVLAVSENRAELEMVAAAYKKRHAVACKEWNDWDNTTLDDDWTDAHSEMFDCLTKKHRIFGVLIPMELVIRSAPERSWVFPDGAEG